MNITSIILWPWNDLIVSLYLMFTFIVVSIDLMVTIFGYKSARFAKPTLLILIVQVARDDKQTNSQARESERTSSYAINS